MSHTFLRGCALCLLAVSVVMLLASQALYAFAFDPDVDATWTETARRGLVDWGGWWSFTRSTPGLLLRGGGLLVFVGALAGAAFIRRINRKGEG
ncbi:MAG: hypothetical protein ACI9K5_002793 [Gammaproteobacteria bacterium]